MCGKGFVPLSAFAVIENRVQHAFQQFRIIEQKQRGRRISHIHRADRTVAEIFFGKKKQVALGIFHQFMRGDRLPVSHGTKFGIFFSSRLFRIFHQAVIKTAATVHERTILRGGLFKSLPDIFFSVMFPVSHAVILKILDSIEVVIANHQETGGG